MRHNTTDTLGGKRTVSDVFNQALDMEAASIAAGKPSKVSKRQPGQSGRVIPSPRPNRAKGLHTAYVLALWEDLLLPKGLPSPIG